MIKPYTWFLYFDAIKVNFKLKLYQAQQLIIIFKSANIASITYSNFIDLRIFIITGDKIAIFIVVMWKERVMITILKLNKKCVQILKNKINE